MKPRSFVTALLVGLLAIVAVAAQRRATTQADPLTNFERQINAGKLAQVEKPLLDVALADPMNVRALELVGRLRFRQNRISEAAALYQRALGIDANYPPARLFYAYLLISNGQTDDAKRLLGSIDRIPAGLDQLEFAKALVAVSEFDRAVKLVAGLPLTVRNGDGLSVLAASYLGLRDRPGFEAVLLATKKNAANAKAAMGVVEVLIAAGLREQTIDVLRAVVAAAPRNGDALVLLAKEEIYLKQFDSAAARLDRAATIAPKSAEVFFVKALLAAARGDSAKSLTFLEQAIALEPDSVNLLSQLAVAAMRSGQPSKAVAATERLVSLQPDNADFLYLLGAASLQTGNLTRAQTTLERVMTMRPQDSRACLALGLTLAANRDQVEPARRQLERCLEINPGNNEARYQLGLSYKAQGDNAKALVYLEETVASTPEYAPALRDLGAVYLQTGAEAKAKPVLEKSVALAPQDAETHFLLSRLYNLLGDAEAARRHLEIFRKLRDPKSGGME